MKIWRNTRFTLRNDRNSSNSEKVLNASQQLKSQISVLLISAGNNKTREHVNGTEQCPAAAGKADAEPPGRGVKVFCCANVHTPRPCVCFLWCPRSSAPGPVVPARWAASRGCRTPPDTEDRRKENKKKTRH